MSEPNWVRTKPGSWYDGVDWFCVTCGHYEIIPSGGQKPKGHHHRLYWWVDRIMRRLARRGWA